MVALEGASPEAIEAAAEDRHRLHLRAPPAEARLLLLQREDPLHLDLLLRPGPQLIAERYGAEFVARPRSSLHRENFKRFLRFSRESLGREQRHAPRPALEPAVDGARRHRPLAADRLHRQHRAVRRRHGRGAGARRGRPRLRDAADERRARRRPGATRRWSTTRSAHSAPGSSPRTCRAFGYEI